LANSRDATADRASSPSYAPASVVVAENQIGSPARAHRETRREFAPPMRAAAANAVAIAAAAANVALAAVSAAKQEPRYFQPHRQRMQGYVSPGSGDIHRSHFMQVSGSPRSPHGSPRASPRPGGSPRPARSSTTHYEEDASMPLRSVPGAEGARNSPSRGSAGPRGMLSVAGSAPAPVTTTALRSKFAELRDEMKRRRSGTSPTGTERDRRQSPMGTAGEGSESADIARMASPSPPRGCGSEAREQATRLCPPFLERGRPAPQALPHERSSAAVTARDLTRKEHASDAAQSRASQAQSSRTSGQSRSPRPGAGSTFNRGRGSPRSPGEANYQGGRSSPTQANATAGLWRCPSARRVAGSSSCTSRRPVPPISGLLQLRHPTAAPASPSQPSAAGSMASAAGAALAELVAKADATAPLEPVQQNLTDESLPLHELPPAPACHSGSIRSGTYSHGRGPASTRLDTANSNSMGSLSVGVADVAEYQETQGYGSSLSASGGGSGSASYSVGGGSLSLVVGPVPSSGTSVSARQRRQSPPAALSTMPPDQQPTLVFANPCGVSPPSSQQPPLSTVAVAAAALNAAVVAAATPQPSPRTAGGGLASPRVPSLGTPLEETDPDLLHQAVLQFSQQRPLGRQPLIRTSPGVYLHGKKKLVLVLKNGRLMVRIGGSLVALSEALLASPALGGTGSTPISSSYEASAVSISSALASSSAGGSALGPHGSFTISATAATPTPMPMAALAMPMSNQGGAPHMRLVNRHGR
jgi:hypothetical protein